MGVMLGDMDKIPAMKYTGIVFDVEEVDGQAAAVIPMFSQLFAKAKSLNLTTVVTTSHSAPYLTYYPPTNAV